MQKKIKCLGALRKTLCHFRKKGKKIVFTNGCFDLLHPGHISYLRKARGLGDILIIGLNSDASVRRLKGRGRPLVGQKKRAEILASLEFVDFVTVFGEDTPIRLIKELKPHVLVKGGDWKKDSIVGKAVVESYGGKVICAPYIKGYSTSALIKKICRNLK